MHQLKQRIDASGKETSTNHRAVRFDCSGVGSYQNEVRESSETILWTLVVIFSKLVRCLQKFVLRYIKLIPPIGV